MKKKILIVLAIIIVIALVVVGYFVVSDLGQEEKLQKELEEIHELVNAEQTDTDAIKERLTRSVTNGDYAIVERAFKQYLNDCIVNMTRIAEILNDERITASLTAENYKKDGPEFSETKAYLEQSIQELQKLKDEYTELYTQEKVMSYINDKGLDEYYIEYYKNEIVGDVESNLDGFVEFAIGDTIATLETSEKIIDFLIENKNAWQIEEDKIVFNNQSLSEQYDALVEQL